MTNHRENKFPSPCCNRHGNAEGGEPRVKATCVVDEAKPDQHGTMTITPRCVCKMHCPVCSAEVAHA
jgi:hypothetical protein